MNRYVRSNSCCSVLEQVDDLRLDRDVERRDGLVADDEVRIDARARARCRCAAAGRPRTRAGTATPASGGQADALEQLPHPRRARRAVRRSPWTRIGSPIDAPDRVPRVERGERVLEDHLHAPAQRPQLRLAERRDVLPVELDAPGGRLVQADDRPPDRRLPAARLADEPERLAALDRQRDAVDGLDVADVPVEHDPALDREVDLEIVDLDERLAHATRRLSGARHSSSGTGLKHATVVPRLDLRERRHSCSRESGTSYGSAARTGTPRAPSACRAASPSIGCSARPARCVEARDELQQAERVRVPRPLEDLVGRARLHEHAAVHDVRRARTSRRRRRGRA